ncbi:flavodoxin family protein [Halobacillus sp. Marseille-Q1614]|uniref:flavodoxin family protein n=1 Tax=Halobacillus sp. Marseille-Q1614 TaxID=2709134 RepID=UPI00156E5A53|nr:NAD(P)H-dependent oxidoreductase [Halobacillus sp. Marseille-Q1614]
MKALLLNCSLEKGCQETETENLLDQAAAVFQQEKVDVERIHLRDFQITFGITSSLDGDDDWPFIFESIRKADIVLFATPIALGEQSSIATLIIERLQGYYDMKDKKGQQLFYNKVGGVIVSDHGDGGSRSAAQSILYSLGMLGFTIPPQSSAICTEGDPSNEQIVQTSTNLVNLAEILNFHPIPVLRRRTL